MDIAFSVVIDILSKLVDAIIREASYSFLFNKYVKELEIEQQNLQSKIGDVLGRAEEAKRKTERVVSEVETWLNEADSLIGKVVVLQEKTMNKNKTSCFKYCPNLIRHYSLAKRLKEKTNEIMQHVNKSDTFMQFSRLATLVGMDYFPSEGFVRFESRQVAYDRLIEAIKDEQVHKIGLYGMGGCGKTTMVKEVGKEAEQLFDKVIFVVVSNTIDIRKIQGEIASQLDNLKLEEEGELGRARRLSMRLTSGEKFLIILDDVWKTIEFEKIGIPIVENEKSCTILITTRKLDVCRGMNCKISIPLEGLSEDEAWGLFQKHADIFDDNSYPIKGLAQEITKECDGLPIAIAAVASTLKGKPQVEWEETLKTLRDSSLVDIEEDSKNPYTCLRLSYDKLENEVAKSLFLLCSVFPEDYEIPIDELTMIGVGLGFVEVHSYQRARNQVLIKGTNKLMDSCLLLDGERSGCVKMHDLVRDVGLWIVQKENKFVKGQLKENVITKENKLRYLWIDKVEEFPHKLDCPELEFLHVSTKSKHGVDVPNDIFKGLEMLKVLTLRNASQEYQVLQLPMSFHLLKNLRCLFLLGWILGDISFIGSLKRLASLKLWSCSFDELPKLIAQQKNLRLLDIFGCKIQRNPYEVMARCSSRLEVLNFCYNKVLEWENQSKDGAEFFDKIRATPALESYCIDLGDDNHDFYKPGFLITKSLYVKDVEKCMSNATIKDLMQRAEVLYLRGIQSCKNIIPHTFRTIGGNFDGLTQLAILHSDTIECVIDTTHLWGQIGIIPKLTHLTIKGLKNLRTFCRGQLPLGLFAKLEFLEIHNCDSLEHIIVDEVKEIVADGSEYQRSVGFAFPKLKTVIIISCGQLEFLIPVSYAHSLIQLEWLYVKEANKLKSLFSPSIYEDLDQDKFGNVQFLALNNLTLKDLPNMVSICPENYHLRWPSLKELTVQNVPQLNIKSINHWIGRGGLRKECNSTTLEDLLTPLVSLKGVYVRRNDEMEIVFDGERLLNNGEPVTSSLHRLGLEDLPELRHIWRGPKNSLLLQNIVILDIVGCENLRVILPASILTSLPMLKRLIIVSCNELEGIMEENENVSNPHQLVFPNLTMIIIRQCHKLKRVFPFSSCLVLPKLRALLLEEASQLEQVPWDMIPNVEYVLLWKLPTLSPYQGQHIDFQSVRYLLVQQCPKLPLTSTVNLQQLVQILDNEKVNLNN